MKSYAHFLTGIGLFVALKLAYAKMAVNELLFALAPTNKLVSIYIGDEGKFMSGKGYFYQDLNILIEKSCSGINFLILSFITTYLLCLRYFKTNDARWILIPIILLSSYLVTIFVNTARIIIAISLNKLGSPIKSMSWFHQAQGTFVYLFFLLCFYLVAKYLFTKYAVKNEGFA